MDWQEIGRSRMDILKMAPRQLYEAYTQARKHPYLIHSPDTRNRGMWWTVTCGIFLGVCEAVAVLSDALKKDKTMPDG